ncbi:hypothetical protein [Azospirillum argentinense]|uniref:hypothetical protein n=1 Tax=Azospirillum argentinense TaxID=2970906 RepID=UPI0020002ABC|nr:hypothetical protein [Azospirillum argentinense]
MQALGWLRDVMATDGDRILGWLKTILTDPVQGQAIRNDLEAGLGALPSWMVPMVKDLLATTAPQKEQDGMPQRGIGG